jgi:uncharacterized protein YyaL (SSP411 family)
MSELHFSPRPNRAAQINWQPYGEAAFQRAQAENKPVLLAISAVWCHWCHVMDETTYSDESVIRSINERYIPVRVDNDKRPDVNSRYNMGGWPTTVFLTPEGEILYGGTYIPPEAMQQVLAHIDRFYADPHQRLAAARRGAELRSARAGRARSPRGGALDPATARNILETLSANFDDEHGGFGADQKFPHVPALQFLLDLCARERNERAQFMAQRTLHAMAEGGMYDHVEGGFFRYSTTPDFSVPHFEKMLEDLGGLLLACSRASAVFADEALAAVAVDVKRYLDARLWIPELNAYGGSQDADEEYYALDERARARRAAPYVDKTPYTSWNAQAAGALLVSGPLVERAGADAAAWRDRGVAILESLWTRLLDDGLMCRYFDGSPRVRGLLVDQVWSAWAALAAFASTADSVWLERTGALIAQCDELFDAAAEVYVDRLPLSDDAGRLAERTVSLEENALMARVLLAYGAASGQTACAQRAENILRRLARDYERQGMFAAGYASAVLDVLEPPIDAIIGGATGDPRSQKLREAALRIAVPPLRVIPIDPPREPQRAAALGYDGAHAGAYVCRNKTCFARVSDPGEMNAAFAAAAGQVR